MSLKQHWAILVVVAVLYFFVHVWTFTTSAYGWIPWIDIPAHLVFGFWLAFLFLCPGFWFHSTKPLIILATVVVLGLGWEAFEFSYDVFVAHPNGTLPAQHGILDSIGDMLNNVLGAALTLLAWRKYRSSNAVRENQQVVP